MTETYKVVLLGDTNVGKTAILTRFAKGTFKKEIESTMGAHFMSKMVQLPNSDV
jgi:GTPase SAR1 family protein